MGNVLELITHCIFSQTPIEVNFFLLFFGGHFKMHCGKKPFVAATLTLICKMTGLKGGTTARLSQVSLYFVRLEGFRYIYPPQHSNLKINIKRLFSGILQDV